MGRLLAVEFPFFYLGLFFFSKVVKKTMMFHPTSLYLLLAISIFPSALTNDNPHALRASCLMILLPIITASGICLISGKLKNEFQKNIFLGITIILILANSVFYIGRYVNSYDLRNKGHQNFLVVLSEKLNRYKDNYSRIYIEDIGNQPSIYVAGYCNIKPSEFQNAEKKFDPPTGDHIIQLGKYFFLDRNKIENEVDNSSIIYLVLLQLKKSNYHLIDSVDNGFQKMFFYQNRHEHF